MNGGISDYALEQKLKGEKSGRRHKRPKDDRGNIPADLQSSRVDEKIREFLTLGWDTELVTQHLLQWNQAQPSPMAVGQLKKRLFLAFSTSKS